MILALLGLLVWITAIALMISGTFLALKSLSSVPPHLDAPFGLYPVSIMKPLKGVEEGLRENLESFFNLDYPDFELVFSVADERDPVRALINELIARFPRVRARVLIGQVEEGPNPKVNNLIRAYDAAVNDLILISDSNVRVSRDYLKRLVAHLDTGVGMVTSTVAGTCARSLGGHLEAIYLNTFYARWMYAAVAFGKPAVVGKSMLFSRKTADRFGGIRTLSRYLHEDYMAGLAMRRLGLRVVVATDPVPQHIGQYRFRDFWDRHIRWGRIRKSQAPIAFLVEPLLGPIISGLIGAFSVAALFHLNPFTFFALHLALWALCDLLLALWLDPEAHAGLPIFWFSRELLAIPLWIHTALGNTVIWRGRRLTIEPGGLLKMPAPAVASVGARIE